ncbi:MAG: class I SAM-dependent RNA methyltransferase [Bacteroidetes bacterium]|nr:class I SAM-dependent RNA methyltransferase [Bacteroidota bacterium]
MNTFDLIATTQFGLEEILAAELKALGAENTEILNRAVKFTGTLELLYKSNYLLRTCLKILKPIATFEAYNETQLYENIKKIDWSQYLTLQQTFAIDGTTSGEVFTHSKFVALKSKDAIVDQFRENCGVRPSVDPEDPDIRINIHISDINCSVSIDSTGVPLNKRGYRLEQTFAPISEVLAAGIILLSGWDRKTDFYDPMCGSGTFSIEAALLAQNIPNGQLRKFLFEKWSNFDAILWQTIKDEAEKAIIPFEGNIYATDLDKNAIEISLQNARRAGVAANIEFAEADFLQSKVKGEGGLIVMNPPYNERLKNDDIVEFYSELGTHLKHFYNGCDAWIISGNLEALKFIGLRPSRKIKLYNGQLECRLQKYELYRGSKRGGNDPLQIISPTSRR